MPPRRSGNTLKSAQTVPGNQCSRPLKRVFADPLVLLVFVGVGGVYAKMVQDGPQAPASRLHSSLEFSASHTFGSFPPVFPASISEIFGVTHSNLSSFFSAASSLSLSRSHNQAASSKQQAAHAPYPILTQPCSTLQYPPTRPPTVPSRPTGTAEAPWAGCAGVGRHRADLPYPCCQGLSSGTPVASKSARLRVTTTRLCTSAVAAIRPSRNGLGSGPCRAALRRATAASSADWRCRSRAGHQASGGCSQSSRWPDPG
jgi:hypothetical protein